MGKKKGNEGWVIPWGEKIAMFFGAGSYQAGNTFVSSFMSIYLLMVGINPAIAATAMLFLKAWDAFNDVLFGYLMDKIHFKPKKNAFTRWLFSGKYMPWFRILFLLIPIGTIIIFTISTKLPLWIRVAQYIFGYLLYDMGMTVGAAFTLVPISATNNFDERNFVLSWNGLGQGIGSLPVVFLGTVMIAGKTGYLGAAVIFSILGILLALIPAVFVKERNVSAVNPEEQKNYTIKEMFTTLKHLPELFFLLLGIFCWGIFYTTSYGMFVAYYIFNDAGLSIILTLVGVLPSILLLPFLPSLFKHLDKIVVARAACTLFAVTGVIICLLGPDFFRANIPILCLVSLIQSTCYVMTMFSGGQLTPDLVEMAKYRTGQDAGGIISAVGSFVGKPVNSLVSSVSLFILGASGFISVEASSFDELAKLNEQGIGLQTDRAIVGLWNVTYLFPIIGFALAAVAFCFVRVKREKIRIYMKINSGEISREEGNKLLSEIR